MHYLADASHMSNFRPINRDMDFLMAPSVDEWLPQRHLARFVVEVIEGLDLRAMTGSYCWALLSTATPSGCFPAATWSVRLTIR